MGFLGGSTGKEPACNAGDLSSIPGLGRSPGETLEEEMATHSSILAWRIPRMEEPGGLRYGSASAPYDGLCAWRPDFPGA